MEEYGNLLNSFSDYLIYDERKGRVLHTRHLNKAQFYEVWRFHFNRLRPEFSPKENLDLRSSLKTSRAILGFMRHQNGREAGRAFRLDVEAYPSPAVQKIMHQQLDYMAPTPAMIVAPRMQSWRDATKSINYVTEVAQKIEKYGLQFPYLSAEMTQEQKAVLEEQLYNHFKDLLTN